MLGEQLPNFVSVDDLMAEVAASFRPPARISVSAAAERHRRLHNPGGGYSGPWSNDFAPYLTEPMDRAISRDVDTTVLVGPAQFGKSEIFLNIIAHAAKYRAGDVLLFQPTRDLATDFADRRLTKRCLEVSPDLRHELGDDRSDDKVLTKTFRNGMMVSVVWPVTSQVASRPVPTVMIDERDSMPDDLAGEGDPVSLGRKRTSTFGRNASVIVASSPKRTTYTGIMPLYDQGDRRLWFWPCALCHEYFSPGFGADRKPTLAHLHLADTTDTEEARAAAHLVCPHCKGALHERDKVAMNARGVWLAAGQAIDAQGNITGPRTTSRIASYWLSGLAVRTRLWGDVAAEYVAAKRAFDQRQDETELKAFWNTTLGAPYRPAHLGAEALDPAELRARVEDLALLRLPEWAGFCTAGVDVQGNRFDVQIVAWGPDGRSAPIAFFSLFKAMDGVTGEERMVDPARRAEDWDLLLDAVINRPIPRADGASEVLPLRTAIDTGGAAGVTSQAYAFWLRLRDEGEAVHRRVMLIKGASSPLAPPLAVRKIELGRDGRMMKRGVVLTMLNTGFLKDALDARLRQAVRGNTGYMHISRYLDDRWFEEITGEVKTPAGWIKQPNKRNEALDTYCYALAGWMRLGGHRIDWANPPEWARPQATGTLQPAQAGPQAAPQAGGERRSPQAASAPLAPPRRFGPRFRVRF